MQNTCFLSLCRISITFFLKCLTDLKPSVPWVFFEKFFIMNVVSLIDIGMFRFYISSLVSFANLCHTRSFSISSIKWLGMFIISPYPFNTLHVSSSYVLFHSWYSWFMLSLFSSKFINFLKTWLFHWFIFFCSFPVSLICTPSYSSFYFGFNLLFFLR